MNNGQQKPLDPTSIRARLAEAGGKRYWRSLQELAETDEFQAFLDDEFPQQSRPLNQLVDRRQFLTLMGASLALAGLTGCRFLPQDKIIPYVNKPEDVVPGLPLFFATAVTLGGYAFGVVAESHEGRPTKLEGNALHPASLGASNPFAQASILNLYDPDRAVNITSQGDIRTWDGQDSFVAAVSKVMTDENLAALTGLKLRVLTETVTSPTLAAQIRLLLARYPNAKWHQYEPVNRDNVHAGAQLAFGEPLNPIYHLDKADVVLALDGDFLTAQPASVRYAREFMDRRRVRKETTALNRLYAVESMPTVTGATADHRLNLRASEIEAYVRAIAAELGVPGMTASGVPASIPDKWVKAVAADLKKSGPAALVIVGDHQPPAVHALAHAIHQTLGATNNTVVFTPPVEAEPTDKNASLKSLVDDMNAGQVEMLLVLGGNPAYTAPADIDFAKPLRDKKVRFSAHLSSHFDETAALCDWHIPESHYLEAWGDTRAYDGTVSIVQPLIAPLYDSKSALELLNAMLVDMATGYDVVRNYWKAQKPQSNAVFNKFWEKTLNDGVMAGTALPTKTVSLSPTFAPPAPTPASNGLEIIFRPDPTIHDGRFANNGWLQELPKPFSKLTWDNAAYMSPATAAVLQLAGSTSDADLPAANEKVVRLTYKGRTVEAPVWLLPGHPDNAITVHLGYGRTKTGQAGNGIGFNANLIRTSDAPWHGADLKVENTGTTHKLATTSYHHQMEGRDLIRVAPIEEYRKKKGDLTPEGSHYEPAPTEEAGSGHAAPQGTEEKHLHQAITLYDGKDFQYDGYAWGMSVDLTTCIGCNACVTACQAENNIPVVGKGQVLKGRAMHWIRIDTYYEGGTATRPDGTYFQPVMCMHCEQAPCEPVCPVAATVHSHEGLNQMVYNRCVGTKYCSNNCPYKVRRFNFYKYTAGQPNQEAGPNYDAPSMKLLSNPNVTVRGRGVMEKCTFCVQRINAARITSKKEGRQIKDGEIVTACQQACPTNTIIFGNIADKESQVSKLKAEPHDYSLLDAYVNTRPRLTYLAKVTNPNPELEPAKAETK